MCGNTGYYQSLIFANLIDRNWHVIVLIVRFHFFLVCFLTFCCVFPCPRCAYLMFFHIRQLVLSILHAVVPCQHFLLICCLFWLLKINSFLLYRMFLLSTLSLWQLACVSWLKSLFLYQHCKHTHIFSLSIFIGFFFLFFVFPRYLIGGYCLCLGT